MSNDSENFAGKAIIPMPTEIVAYRIMGTIRKTANMRHKDISKAVTYEWPWTPAGPHFTNGQKTWILFENSHLTYNCRNI